MDAWELISSESKRPVGVLTDDFIKRFDSYLHWELLSANYDFSIEMLRIYFHRVNWIKILKRQLFHESFLREMAFNFDLDCWAIISRYQNLSETFIHDYAAALEWDDILLYQNISGSFIDDHKMYISAVYADINSFTNN